VRLPSLRWLTSPGGQAQVTFNQDVDTLASALVIENQATTVANHLLFETAARTVRTQARTILAHPALLPSEHRAAYVSMLNDFITLANMLQPGARYGTTAQDYTAWYTALRALQHHRRLMHQPRQATPATRRPAAPPPRHIAPQAPRPGAPSSVPSRSRGRLVVRQRGALRPLRRQSQKII
jgi:hypothetical protein